MEIIQSKNWFDLGFVSPAVDQDVTNASGIIAVIKQAESSYNIRYDLRNQDKELFSIQEPLDWINKVFLPFDYETIIQTSDNGIIYGHPIFTFQYLHRYGVHRKRDYMDYPFLGVEGLPKVICNVSKFAIRNWVEIQNYNMQFIIELLNDFPLVGYLKDTAPFYYTCRKEGDKLLMYPLGALTAPTPPPTLIKIINGGARPHIIAHAILVIGYAIDNMSGIYFLIQNSWGERWGENGRGWIRCDGLEPIFYYASEPYLERPPGNQLILPPQI